ncbi:MAG: Acetylornithine deacetylase [Cryobacterium sp.]|jgi:acetylornithine deacetylase|nr:Acetylornithine deacetylase [Cryobacterium sp.]
MLNGHLDTVGVTAYEGDPFNCDSRAGRIYGRGTFDMKGGVAAILVAAAKATSTPLAGDVLVTLVADEEFGSVGTEEVLRSYSADAAIVAEPSGLELTLAHRGFAWFEVRLRGQSAHGSMPEQGIDAIAHAGLVLRALDEVRTRLAASAAHPTLGRGTVRVSMISGGEDAATVASSCRLTVERRFLPGESPDAVELDLRGALEVLERTVPHFRFELTRLVAREAFEADPEWPIVRTVAGQAQRVLGHPAATRGEPFWTDAGLLHEAGIPCLVIGVDGGGAHADEEWVDAGSVLRLTEVLTGTIIDFCG